MRQDAQASCLFPLHLSSLRSLSDAFYRKPRTHRNAAVCLIQQLKNPRSSHAAADAHRHHAVANLSATHLRKN